jgi:carbon-monoxide dehydrogenase large subunit
MDLSPGLLIGQPIDRAEDPRFTSGRGNFIDDLQREGMLHAAVFRSGVAHGRIRSIDTTAAQKTDGVHAVITAVDIGEKSRFGVSHARSRKSAVPAVRVALLTPVT